MKCGSNARKFQIWGWIRENADTKNDALPINGLKESTGDLLTPQPTIQLNHDRMPVILHNEE